MKTNHKLFLARTLYRAMHSARALAGLNDKVVIMRRNLVYSLDLSEGIDFYIYLFGVFEIMTAAALQRIVKPGDCVVDIGANIGAHTLPLARRVGETGRVFAFEPTDYAFGKLQTNLALNPDLKRVVTAAQRFLGRDDASGTPDAIYSAWPLVAREGLHEMHSGEAKTTHGALTVALDRYLADAGAGRIDVIKLDVDGYECDVLTGAQQTIDRWKPTFVMEIAPSALEEHGTSVGELLGFLVPRGYWLFKLDGSPLPHDADKIRSLVAEGESLNVIARVPDQTGRTA